MKRKNLFIEDAGLGYLRQIEYGLRVVDGEEADHIAITVLGFEGFKGSVFKGGQDVHCFPEKMTIK